MSAAPAREAPRAKAVAGVLVKCDPAMKEFILYTNEQSADPFVIDANLDDTHIVVKADYVKFIKEELEKLQDTLSYNPGIE